MNARESWCPGCAEDRDFETPPCAEHGADCPELCCSMCGWALIGSFEVTSAGRDLVLAAASGGTT